MPRLPFLHQDSFANVQGLGSLPFARLERRIGHVRLEARNRPRKIDERSGRSPVDAAGGAALLQS